MSLLHSPKIVTNGLVLCLDAASRKSYPGTGNVWRDLSGNGNNGTLVDGPTFSSANGGSIFFDGVNDYVNCGAGLAISGSWTISAFFNSPISSTGKMIFTRSGGASASYAQNYLIYVSSNNKFYCQTNADSYKNVESTTTMISNTWYYVTGVYDSTLKILSIYINGNLEGSSTPLIGNPTSEGEQYVILGAVDGLSVAAKLTGSISQASIYNKALSASEIKQNFNALRGRYGI